MSIADLGGELKMPLAAFLSREDTAKAVEDFLDTGEPSKKLTWVKLSDLAAEG